jgi:magnesium transporter
MCYLSFMDQTTPGNGAPPRARTARRSPRVFVEAGLDSDALPADLASPDAPVKLSVTDYCPERSEVRQIKAEDLQDFIAGHRPEWSRVRWIDVDGVNNSTVVGGLSKKYGLHPLAVEDLVAVGQRPKVDFYPASDEFPARLFLVMRMVMLEDEKLKVEQISLFAGHTTVLTFQETTGDVWDPIRQRIAKSGSRLRENDASFLVYSLVDAVVDHCFPILEYVGEKLEDLEHRILENPTPDALRETYKLKRELLTLRRSVWPMREVVHQLQGETNECFSDTSRTYMRDVYDHVVQIIDVIEAYRETSLGLTETYMTVIGNRMNQIMKVLTIIGTIFIPLTFLAGVYGMNFKFFPELEWKWAYPAFWVVCVVLATGMLAWFRKHRWL